MRVSLNWLRELVPFELETAALCERLSLSGLEVEAVECPGEAIRGVVVAEIVEMGPHPNADRLSLCRVRSGDGEPLPVVCGARNMKAGDRVALARPGTVLPGDRRIERTRIRGETSHGMLCSEVELGLSEESAGIMILSGDASVGRELAEVLGLDDTLLEIGITPNRGDCLSMVGIAREVAALTGVPMRPIATTVHEDGEPAERAAEIRIEAPDACGRYAGRILRDVRIGPSPLWLRRRLESLGVRSINNAVDITNYVMLETGQPLHAFDYDRLPEPRIVVRRAGDTRRIRTLDGADRSLEPDDLLITTGAEPVAIAGVMGGESSEVSEATTTVLLESAWFHPSTVRRTARRLDLHSESSYRFERGVDPEGTRRAADRAAALFAELAGARVAPGVIDVVAGIPERSRISLRPSRIEHLLGVRIADDEVGRILESLGCEVSRDGEVMEVTVPGSRSDLTREIDLVEEVARIHGYDRIPATMPSEPVEAAELPDRMRHGAALQAVLEAAGLSEAIGLSFVAPRTNQIFPGLSTEGRAVRVVNPLSADETELRRSLLGNLVSMWRINRHQGAGAVGGYSLNKVFWHDGAPREGWRLAGVLAGNVPRRGLGRPEAVPFAIARGVVEAVLERLHLADAARWERLTEDTTFHPGKSARIRVDGDLVGVLGALHPEVERELDLDDPHWLFELDLQRLLMHRPQRRLYSGLPRFPAVVRDLAVIADRDFASVEVVDFLRERREDLVESVALFDEYAGDPIPDGQKSLAYSISYRANDRTLTDDEVNRMHSELLEELCRVLPVRPR